MRILIFLNLTPAKIRRGARAFLLHLSNFNFMAAYDGASSSSSSSSGYSSRASSTHDVFLNFRGAETRNNFTGFLHSALKREGINVFIDSEGLWGGEEIQTALLNAIKRSKISIPVFSNGYADSRWCLMELVEIVRCHRSNGQKVLPIFLDVEPRDVRRQTGSFEGSFLKHKEIFDTQKIQSWKDALTVVGRISGYDLNQVNGNQPELVKLVVDWALSELTSNRLGDVKNPIGIDARVEDLLSLLNMDSDDVRFVGICGIGGIGKTTIAMTLYNCIFKSFEMSSFVANVREEASSGPNGVVSLQEKLIYSVSKKEVKACIVKKGQQLIKEKLQEKKVLLILDDVDSHSQLKDLAIDSILYGPGSRIIITSRDEHVLNVAKVDGGNIYWPKELDDEQSLQLFSLHAFSSSQPPKDFIQLSHDVIHLAGGLPLTLEVLGSALFAIREKEVWQSMLGKLKNIPNKEVHQTLKISYDDLEKNEKSIFLDAACFFVGWKKETVISIWDACGFDSISAIKKLTQRSLLKFITYSNFGETYDELRMHDQIQAMGRGIVYEESPMEPGKRSRLWSRDEILEALEEPKGTEMIEGILLPMTDPLHLLTLNDEAKSGRSVLRREDFAMMSKLRFLCVYEVHSEGEFLHLPPNLRWFRWEYCPREILSANFYHKKLVYMDLSWSRLRQAWTNKPRNENQQFQKLKVLLLQNCDLPSGSPDFSWFPYLVTLDLKYCKNVINLHKSIGDLKYLVELDLDSTQIEELPNSICRLSSLKVLILSWCSSFKNLPKSIGDLKSLVKLDLCRTKIEEIPNSICRLNSLKILILGGCSSVKNLPESIGDLKSLVELDLEGTKIEKLPSSICSLSSLEVLILNWCLSLKNLPESIADLKSLVKLDLEGTKIEEIPSNICKLSSLRFLNLNYCESVKKLPDSIGDLNSLVQLMLKRTKIEELPDGVWLLEKLEVLMAEDCHNLVSLPLSWGRMRCLRIVNLVGTRILLPLDGSLILPNLVELELGNNRESSLPPWISGLPQLQKLVLLGYTSLESLPKLPLTLTNLHIENCISLKTLPDLSSLKNLRNLRLSFCKELKNIRGLEGMESLEGFFVEDCDTITDIPRKTRGQGILLVDESQRSDSLNVNDGIYTGLILCLVFSLHLEKQEEVHEGWPVNIRVHTDASVRGKHRRTECVINLQIEGVKYTTERDIVYIHHFKGFDWFGLPLEGKDAIEKISISAKPMLSPSNPRTECEVKFWKLILLENTAFREQPQMTNQEECSACMVADFFNFSHDDAARSYFVPEQMESSHYTMQHFSSSKALEIEESNPVPEQVEETGMEMAQLVCGGCRTLLVYARGAQESTVKCSYCHAFNLTSPASGNFAHVTCGQCHTLLMYPYGLAFVKCAICQYVTNIGVSTSNRVATDEASQPSSSNQMPDTVWKSIWGCRTLPKIQRFLWRSCTSELTTAAKLRQHDTQIDVHCPRCGALETMSHILLGCVFARAVWFGSSLSLTLTFPPDVEPSLLVWIQHWDTFSQEGEQVGWEMVSLISFLCWYLWLSRTDMIFSRKNWTPEDVIHMAELAFHEYYHSLGSDCCSDTLLNLVPKKRKTHPLIFRSLWL